MVQNNRVLNFKAADKMQWCSKHSSFLLPGGVLGGHTMFGSIQARQAGMIAATISCFSFYRLFLSPPPPSLLLLPLLSQAGFGHDYKSVSEDVPAYNHLLRVLPRCFTEVMLRVANPIRPLAPGMFKNGPKGSSAFLAFQREMGSLLDQLQVGRGTQSCKLMGRTRKIACKG
jgi:hypothetical protein